MLKAYRPAQVLVAGCICASMLLGQHRVVAAAGPRKADATTNLFATELQRIVDVARRLEEASSSKCESILDKEPSALQEVLRGYLEDGKWDSPQLLEAVRHRVGEDSFQSFLSRFGIDPGNQRDQIWELRSQLARFSREAGFRSFQAAFTSKAATADHRKRLVKATSDPWQLTFALRHCPRSELTDLRHALDQRRDLFSRTDADSRLLDYVTGQLENAIRKKDDALAAKWQGVLAQLAAQPTRKGRQFGFSKAELFAMLRNAERTLDQRTQPFLDFTSLAAVPPHLTRRAQDLVEMLDNGDENHQIAGHVRLATIDDAALKELQCTLRDILHNEETRQAPATRQEVLAKHALIEAMLANNDSLLRQSRDAGRAFVAAILESLGQQYRSRFIHGVVLIRGDNGLKYRLLESFPMIVAGDTYPYQWKHDNEVNIGLLLANVDPHRAAQSLRFIVYYSMWRSERARELGLYGWLPQITFGNRQNGRLPTFGGKRYFYFPDFRFRPTQSVDAENERNRTSEIMQLPFFAWTVERVFVNLRERDEQMADAFLREIYPYVSANTKAIRTALDPFNEGLLSGRDAWVNGMDNAWYHLVVMRRHLPERAIPSWAQSLVDQNRVDNRVGKQPGNPVDPALAKGRPSDFYYASKVVFYDIASDVGLSPQVLYHASPYNAKDVAITGVMAAALRSQRRLARRLATLGDDPEAKTAWIEEVAQLEHYLAKMNHALKQHCWSEEDGLFYNCDVSAFVPGVAERLFCRPRVTARGLRYVPRPDYWRFDPLERRYVLTRKALETGVVDPKLSTVWLDLDGQVHYSRVGQREYWSDGPDGPSLVVRKGDPFLAEQFCRVEKTPSGKVVYRPNPRYWEKVTDGSWRLTAAAQRWMGRGARSLNDSDRIESPAIAGFFPLFGEVLTDEQALRQATEIVNPLTWWPVDGIPFPSQPFGLRHESGLVQPNPVYDANRYWQGPTWMAATKPVADGFRAYGFEQLYLYTIRKSIETLQHGRAVEHWNAETGEVNTTNVNFPWAASCMAGSIWSELSPEVRADYLALFHSEDN